jgi:hypothetical protein
MNLKIVGSISRARAPDPVYHTAIAGPDLSAASVKSKSPVTKILKKSSLACPADRAIVSS